MKKTNMKRGHVFITIICLLCIVIIGQAIYILKNKNILADKTDASKEIILNRIETPLVDLTYNVEAVDSVKVKYTKNKPYKITFLADIGNAKDIELFSLYFDSDTGNAVGKIQDKEGNEVKVNLEKNVFSTSLGISESEVNRLVSTQEEIIDNVMSDMALEGSVKQVSEEKLEQKCMKIDTPYTQLFYPEKWKEYLKVEISGDKTCEVKFYCQLPDKKKKELFTYTFGEKSDILVGYLNDIEVGLHVGTEDADASWTEDEIETFYSMREDMNIIIDGLVNTEGFVLERDSNEEN